MSDSNPNPYEAPAAIDFVSDAESESVLAGRLSTVALGLKLLYWGIVLVLLCWICMLPMGWLMIGNGDNVLWGQVIQWGFVGGSLLGIGLVSLGPFVCLTAPPGYGLRRFVVVTVMGITLFWGAIVLQSLMLGVPLFGVASFGLLLPLIGIFFLAFLHRLARVLGRQDLVRRCKAVVFIGMTLFSLVFARWFVPAGAGLPEIFQLAWVIAVFVGALMLFVSYANLVNTLANAIRQSDSGKAPAGIL